MTSETMTAILRFRVTPELERAVKREARRLHLKPREVARMALAHGLAVLAGDDNDLQVMDGGAEPEAVADDD